MMGYDSDGWNWHTCEVERWISNVEYLYVGCQGIEPEGIRQIVMTYTIPDVDPDLVAWGEIANFFGYTPEPSN